MFQNILWPLLAFISTAPDLTQGQMAPQKYDESTKAAKEYTKAETEKPTPVPYADVTQGIRRRFFLNVEIWHF